MRRKQREQQIEDEHSFSSASPSQAPSYTAPPSTTSSQLSRTSLPWPATTPARSDAQDGGAFNVNDSGLSSFLFLDPRLFHKMRLQVPKIHTTVRASVVELVGDLDDIKEISTLYFDTIHAWMPIISKKQFFENLPNRLTQRRSELFLLVLSMKLCCARITTPRTDLYHAVKQFYFDMENSGALSIQVLQAAILIAIYEVGHAIYPAAILSVGSCARYASCLGIDTTARPPKSMQLPWIEVEECCRIWWSIAILDRFVSRDD